MAPPHVPTTTEPPRLCRLGHGISPCSRGVHHGHIHPSCLLHRVCMSSTSGKACTHAQTKTVYSRYPVIRPIPGHSQHLEQQKHEQKLMQQDKHAKHDESKFMHLHLCRTTYTCAFARCMLWTSLSQRCCQSHALAAQHSTVAICLWLYSPQGNPSSKQL